MKKSTNKKTKTTKKTQKPTILKDLAKQLKLAPGELIARLSELGIGISSSKSTLDETTVKKIKRALSRKRSAPKAEAKEARAKKAPEVARKEPPKRARRKRAKPDESVKLAAEEGKGAKAKPETGPSLGGVAVEKKLVKETIRARFPITVKDLASKMSIGPSLLIKRLMEMRVFATINQLIDEEIANEAGAKFGYMMQPLLTVEQETIAVHEKEDVSK